ncbi:hypothetical protein JCGZ_15579 [Jatropha curcas]|uniref:Uncharacterized protein n=1 Tax=Jatropha curcas TaxID=180498 RepID=A0A067KYD4_JATCU|nr:hypothetical protein JCGZ_15579 [Jatropha curcas]
MGGGGGVVVVDLVVGAVTRVDWGVTANYNCLSNSLHEVEEDDGMTEEEANAVTAYAFCHAKKLRICRLSSQYLECDTVCRREKKVYYPRWLYGGDIR